MKKFALLSSLALITACAPQVTKLPEPKIAPIRGPKITDTQLEFQRNQQQENGLFTFEQEIDTVDLFNAAESLILAGQATGSIKLSNIGHRVSNSFYSTKGTTTEIKAEDSPYLEAALKEIGPTISTEMSTVVQLLTEQKVLINDLLINLPGKTSGKSLRPSEIATEIEKQLSFILNYLRSSGVDPLIMTAIEETVELEIKQSLGIARQLGTKIESSQTFTEAIENLKSLMQAFEYKPEKALGEKLIVSENVGRHIDGMDTEQKALTVIVEFWNMMTPEERANNIQPVSEDLYDFLKKQDPKDLRCLSSDSCGRIFMGIAKSKIFKELRKTGLGSLQATFNSSAKQAIIEEVTKSSVDIIAAVPKSFAERVSKSIDEKIVELTSVNSDLKGFTRKVFSTWAQKNLFYSDNISLKGAELERVKIKVHNKNLSIKPINQGKETGPAALGSAMSLAALRWNLTPIGEGVRNKGQLQNTLEQINKMLAIIGYVGPNTSQFPSYLVSLGSDSKPIQFDPETVLGGKNSVVVPDRVRLRGGLEADSSTSKKNVSVRSQAELLRGVSRMMQNFKDWEVSTYDAGLGSVRLAELEIKDLPSDLMQEQLFPKPSLYAMAVGNAALVLHNLIKEKSPVFVVDSSGKLMWADQWSESTESSSAAMAGVVDIVDGKRSNRVQSRDVARYILALIEFYQGIEGVERTQSEILLSKDKEGNSSPVEILLENRVKIKSLIIGLSNFLSHQMQEADGGIIPTLDLTADVVEARGARNPTKLLLDQVLAIKALIAASELLNTKIYMWSALESYYYMNKNLWNPSEEFYQSSTVNKGPLFLNQLLSLESLTMLRPYVSGQSLKQLDRIIEVNSNRLEKSF